MRSYIRSTWTSPDSLEVEKAYKHMYIHTETHTHMLCARSARLQARGCAQKVLQKPEKASFCAQNDCRRSAIFFHFSGAVARVRNQIISTRNRIQFG
jgi:hypothetical protein